jgi:hypothetical protein
MPQALVLLLYCVVQLPSLDATGPRCAVGEDPRWHTAFVLDAASGCPGAWRLLFPNQTGLDRNICSRGFSNSLSQVSAIVLEGWSYSEVRGKVESYGMGGSDAFRTETWRGANTIDDAYVDGVSFTRWTAQGRLHMATYGFGLSYAMRGFGYFVNGNCPCHGGAELPPDCKTSVTNPFKPRISAARP